MDLAQGTVTEQLAEFERMVMTNPVVAAIVGRIDGLGLPGCYLAAGAVFQTVWNCLDGREPCQGIRDYDLLYFDAGDLGWQAEDRVIRRAGVVFADLGVVVEVRNEARVHLWYEDRFGVPCPPYRSTEDAIDSFPVTACCVGVRPGRGRGGGGGLSVYAPHGFGDLFGFVLRPNPVQAPRAVYEAKAARWQREWPRLTVIPWPR